MARVARALGIDRHEAHVTLTEITGYLSPRAGASGPRSRKSARSGSTPTGWPSWSASPVVWSSVDRHTRNLPPSRASPAELDRISGKPPLYPPAAQCLLGGDRLRRLRPS